MTIFLLVFAPFFVGLVALCFSLKSKKTGVLLFHRISKNHPKSLSQISEKQFESFCKEVCLSSKKAVVFFAIFNAKQKQYFYSF